MKTMVRGLLAGAMMVAGTMGALASPEGYWVSASGESAYTVAMCGNGKAICVTLAWLKDDPVNAKSWPYLGKQLITNAKPSRRGNEWRGTIDYFGDKLGGTIRQVNDSQMEISGCKFVFCKSFMLNRGQPK